MTRSNYFLTTLVLFLLLAACGGQTAVPTENTNVESQAEAETASEETIAEHDDAVMAGEEAMAEHDDAAEEAPMDDASTDSPEDDQAGMSDLAVWQQLPLTNAHTGETFTIADFAGKTVFVEPMATWCTNCRRQLINVAEAKSQVGDDAVFIALSVETNLRDEVLAGYANGLGFDWIFAVATPEMLQALVDEYGRTITNPPATPHFIVRPDGSATDLTTGIETADALVAQIQAAAQ